MANLITIEQLLESVDLDFEARWVTKDKNGEIWIWNSEPVKDCNWHIQRNAPREFCGFFITNKIKLSEFDGKDWTECIYEVPRKTTGNEIEQKMLAELERKLNAIVDAAIKAVNELKGAKND